MKSESMRVGPEAGDDDIPPNVPERGATGPLSDAGDTEASSVQAVDAEAFLEKLEQEQESRHPEDKVDVASEREDLAKNLGNVATLIKQEKEKSEKLSTVRQQLGVPHEGGGTLKELEEAETALKEEQQQIELAGEYNDVLGSFSELSREDITHIAETGKTRKGESVRNKYGEEIHSDVAKKLAHMHLNGGRSVTWGRLGELWEFEKMAEQILHDITSAAKGMVMGHGGGKSARAE